MACARLGERARDGLRAWRVGRRSRWRRRRRVRRRGLRGGRAIRLLSRIRSGIRRRWRSRAWLGMIFNRRLGGGPRGSLGARCGLGRGFARIGGARPLSSRRTRRAYGWCHRGFQGRRGAPPGGSGHARTRHRSEGRRCRPHMRRWRQDLHGGDFRAREWPAAIFTDGLLHEGEGHGRWGRCALGKDDAVLQDRRRPANPGAGRAGAEHALVLRSDWGSGCADSHGRKLGHTDANRIAPHGLRQGERARRYGGDCAGRVAVDVTNLCDVVVVDARDVCARNVRIRKIDARDVGCAHRIRGHVDLFRPERKPADAGDVSEGGRGAKGPAQATSAGAYTGATFFGPGTQAQRPPKVAQRP